MNEKQIVERLRTRAAECEAAGNPFDAACELRDVADLIEANPPQLGMWHVDGDGYYSRRTEEYGIEAMSLVWYVKELDAYAWANKIQGTIVWTGEAVSVEAAKACTEVALCESIRIRTR